MKTPRILLAVAALALPSCITTQLAYINEDVAGHQVAATVTLSGKQPVLTFAATKKGIRAGTGK